jgi:hypothetical protein
VIPAEIQEVITGMLLSDACIAFPKGSGKGNASLLIKQKDHELVIQLWDLFSSLGIVGASPRKSSYYDKRYGKRSVSYGFETFTLPIFTDLHRVCYRQDNGKNVKVLPLNIAELLTPVAIAYLLSGD